MKASVAPCAASVLGDAPGDRVVVGDPITSPRLPLHQPRHVLHPSVIVRAASSGILPSAGALALEGFRWAHASSRLNTTDALVPPKPNEFDSTQPSVTLSRRSRTIGMSAKAGSRFSMLALSQMKPLFIIRSE